MRDELQKLAEDIQKVNEAQKLLSSVSTAKMGVEIDKLLNYALNNKIIKGTDDIIALSVEYPDLKDIIVNAYDNHIASKIKRANESRRAAETRYENRYAGTYNSLSEVPGYGTEWNERCRPSGIIIKSSGNERC